MRAFVLRASGSAPHAPVYQFRGSRGTTRWPTAAGIGLGRAGCWNFLLRVGMKPREIGSEMLHAAGCAAPVFVCLDGPVAVEGDRQLLRNHIQEGGCVVGSGDADAWSGVLPELMQATARRCDNPYAALGYRFGHSVELMTPPRWPHASFTSLGSQVQSIGDVVTIAGERQTPTRALVVPQAQAPALLRWRNFVFLNASPFQAFQAWLQGQEDLQPWMHWRHRLFWLDEWVAAVRSRLADCAVPFPAVDALPIQELGRTAVVLRHDLDASRDTSYLDLETRAGVSGVHAILRDTNTRFWINRLAQHPEHESAFHYNTARYSRARNFLGKLVGQPQRTYVPDANAVARDGLLDQVRWAQRHRVGVVTLHRHLSILIYPEWIDGLDNVLREEPAVLGSSSMFRAQVLRWGVDRVDGGRGTYADHPDVQFPFWLPFRPAHAGDGGRLLGGWESASVLEIEPELFEQMIDHRVPGLPQRVFTLNFHPVHARRSTFVENGSLENVRRLIDILKARDIRVLTLRDVFAALNRFVSEEAAPSPLST